VHPPRLGSVAAFNEAPSALEIQVDVIESNLDVLLVEDNPLDAHLVRAVLERVGDGSIAVSHSDHLGHALSRLAQRSFDVVLLDLFLPDAAGVETLRQVLAQAPELPVVVLTGRHDRDAALQAVREGAQDYLVKGQLEGEVLLRALGYAIERHRLMKEVRTLSLRDELTQLHNRRGFFTLAEQQMRLAVRSQAEHALVFIDLDGMKRINDEFGHGEGDRALRDLAGLLRVTFRNSDILARLGGDEFVVLLCGAAVEASRCALKRLHTNLEALNRAPDRLYPLEFSAGVIRCSAADMECLDELLLRARAAPAIA
jgi:two-component system, cell cycle response regulator